MLETPISRLIIARPTLPVGRIEATGARVWTGMSTALTSEIRSELYQLKGTDHQVILYLTGGHTVQGRVRDLRTDTITLDTPVNTTVVLADAIIGLQYGLR